MSISELCIRRPVMTTLITLSFIVFGLFAYRLLAVAALPRVDFPTISVSANLPGASPESMASSVAAPLERQFSTISGITAMTSVSSLGSTNITLQFDLDRNIDGAALDVQAAISGSLRRPEDDFFNRFAALARVMPALPLIGGGETKFQPVFVGDVAEAVARAVDGALKAGATYELGGPEVKSFRDLMQAVLKITNRRRALVPLPFPLARIQAGVMEIANAVSFGLMPHALQLTRDQVTLLEQDNVVSAEASKAGLTLEGIGIKGETIDAIVPSYLYRFRKAGQFEKMADA